jgi:putative membrane protein
LTRSAPPSSPSGRRGRWPRRVFGVGTEPDPRFTLANERTFLAWIRTSLALLAVGVALEAFVQGIDVATRKLLAAAFILLGITSSAAAFWRWMASERSMRTGQPLPAPVLAPLIAYGVAAAGALALVLTVLQR